MQDHKTMLNESTARALRRALDKKVRKLRTMLSADEDITTELDRVVCRLMKLALRTSKAKETPPPTRWMQCKLLDLLTLTEKSIARRKKHYIDSFPFRAIGFGQEENGILATLSKIKEDDTAVQIVNKYQKLLQLSDNGEDNDKLRNEYLSILGLHNAIYDDERINYVALKDLNDVRYSPINFVAPQLLLQPLERTQERVEDDTNVDIVTYPVHDKDTTSVSEHSTHANARYRCKKGKNRNVVGGDKKPEKSRSKVSNTNRRQKNKHGDKNDKEKIGNTRLTKKASLKHSSSNSFVKHVTRKSVSGEHGKSGGRAKRQIKEHTKLQSTASKPIPASIIELCHPEISTQKNILDFDCCDINNIIKEDIKKIPDSNIAATEESLLIEIVMDGQEETIALRRTIGTDAEVDPTDVEHETVLKITRDDSFCNIPQITSENIHSQTMFLYDINEPSTSKGVRHVSMDVQCGPDAITPAFAMPSPVSSVTRMPKVLGNGIRFSDSLTNLTIKQNGLDFGICTNHDDRDPGPVSQRPTLPNIFSKGIKINDSSVNLKTNKEHFGTSTNYDEHFVSITPIIKSSDFFAKEVNIEDSLTNITSKMSMNIGTSTKQDGEICLLGHQTDKSPNIYKEVKVEDSTANVTTKKSSEIGTSTNCNKVFGPISLRINSGATKGIIMNASPTVGATNNISNVDKYVETKYTKMKTLKFAPGIKIGDSLTDLRNKSTTDFSTCTDYIITDFISVAPRNITGAKLGESLTDVRKRKSYDSGTNTNYGNKKSLSPRRKSLAINVKDSDIHTGNEIESTTCTEIVSELQKLSSTVETKLLKPISCGMKFEDSSSEFYGSCSSQKSTQFLNSSKNTSDFQIESSVSRKTVDIEGNSPSKKQMQPKLSCGGVHIHSYREKQISEDIVYQGEWQRNTPDRKKIFNPIIVKKVTDVTVKKKRIHSKEKVQAERSEKLDNPIVHKTPMHVRTIAKLNDSKQEGNKAGRGNNSVPNSESVKKTVRPNKTAVIKVASKTKIISISSKNVKNRRIMKRPSVKSVAIKKDGDNVENSIQKNYIPLYLIRRKNIIDKKNLKQNMDSMKLAIKINKVKSKEQCRVPLVKPKTEEIKEDLMKFSEEPRDNISYIVFRNETDNIHKSASDSQPSRSNVVNKNSANKRSVSPVSQNSSTVSTPDSIATVRASTMKSKSSSKRHSVSSNKSSLVNSESEIPTKNRKYSKRIKGTKKIEVKGHDNKENIPESSKKGTDNRKSLINNVKSAFIGRSKNVFMAQLPTESSPTVDSSKRKPQSDNKSNVPIPTVNDNDEKKRPRTATLSKNKSFMSNGNIPSEENENLQNISSDGIYLVNQEHDGVQENISQPYALEDESIDTIVDNEVLSEWLDSTSKTTTESTESTILSAMRQIVEDRLQFVDNNSIISIISDSTTKTVSHEDGNMNMLDTSMSPTSFKTVVTNEDNLNSTFNSELEDALNRSFDAKLENESMLSLLDTTPTTTDLDMLSFKSITSASKFSEYFLADNEFEEDSPRTQNLNSVRDIFERKEPAITLNTPGALAAQAFSGFSMDAEPIAGDQPDYVNLVDSETGSLALDIARQVASEELFVSGRSSGSYESCLVEEDDVVPNWLFSIISQQQSVVDDDPQQPLLPIPMEVVGEPMLDVNGNAIEPNVGLDAGAGDGRGMHSDHSQDSSGRGTSLSSSEASSGQHSEAILLDPSAFTTQFELGHEPMASAVGATTLVIPLESPDTSLRAFGGNAGNAVSTSGNLRRRHNPLLATSDGEADVSSLDTDVPDFSDD